MAPRRDQDAADVQRTVDENPTWRIVYRIDVDAIIIGVVFGKGARPMHENWVLEIRDACLDRSAPFFFKQWGGTRKKAAGRELQSRTWSEMPCRPASVA